MVGEYVDLVDAAAKTLPLHEHSNLAADQIHDGGGWISRDAAIRYARYILDKAGDGSWAEMEKFAREEGRLAGFEEGWAACLRHTKFAGWRFMHWMGKALGRDTQRGVASYAKFLIRATGRHSGAGFLS